MATSRRISLDVAQRALNEIKARDLPADPLVYEVFYLYTSGDRPDLNRVVDRAMSARQTLNRADMEDIHRRFFGTDLVRHMDETRASLAGEIDQIVGMIEAAITHSVRHGHDFGNASEQLTRSVNHETLRLIVDALVSANREVERENTHLGLRLQKSHEHIADLRKDLLRVCEQSLTDALTGLPTGGFSTSSWGRPLPRAGAARSRSVWS